MILDGEKYACDACIRGHRVSSCTHKGRKLNHVNKKGRPLTQCPHCRGLRKTRAAHVKCDCGEDLQLRHSSSETSESACKCQTGRKCTCALKKDPFDIDDMHRVHSASIHKPRLPGHHSDSVVPRIKTPVFSPAHKIHHHDYHHNHSYTLTRSRTMTESSHQSDSSREASEGPRGSPSPQSAGALPMLQRQNSDPTPSPRPKPAAAPLRLDGQTPMPDFSAQLDMSTVYRALSPGNPARYSFHDLSEFYLDNFAAQMPENLYMGTEGLNDLDENWLPFEMPMNLDQNGIPACPPPITPSDASVDYSFSSQFGIASTGSEPGDVTAQPSAYASQILPYRSTPSGSAAVDTHSKIDIAPQPWMYAMPAYAASDPGVFNTSFLTQDIAFGLGADQSADPMANNQVLNDNIEQFDLTMPMTTEEAVRDWVSNPAQMQDPNFAFEVPTQYLPPNMEGNYDWL